VDNKYPSLLNPAVTRLTPQQIFELIKDDLVEVEDELARQVQSSVHIVHQIGRYLMDAGGKRIRPALLLLGSRLLARPTGRDVIRMAAVVEFLHTATLVHDDIIDEAELRRGRPSVNSHWGNEITVLMGDWLYMVAFENSLKERNFELLDILTRATRKMVEGELIELMHVGNLDLTEANYFDLIRRKTAYLFCASVEIGGLLGGANRDELQSLHDYGMNLGTAFQLIDDVLDFASSEDALGKPAGNDLKE
jgi:octaprenyl-diphosphate synthase